MLPLVGFDDVSRQKVFCWNKGRGHVNGIPRRCGQTRLASWNSPHTVRKAPAGHWLVIVSHFDEETTQLSGRKLWQMPGYGSADPNPTRMTSHAKY